MQRREEFFRVFDRLGSVTDTAAELRLNRNTCYQWVRRAGLTSAVRAKYTPEQKGDFFSVLEREGSVTVAATELSLNVGTAFRWAREAGIASRPVSHRRREEYVRLRATGLSRREAVEALDVPRGMAREWDLGVRKSGGRRIYPTARNELQLLPVPPGNRLPGRYRSRRLRNLSIHASSASRSGR